MDANEYLLQVLAMERLREDRARAAVCAMLARRDRTRATTVEPWTARLRRWWRLAADGARPAPASGALAGARPQPPGARWNSGGGGV
jgi:hypothetical protein